MDIEIAIRHAQTRWATDGAGRAPKERPRVTGVLDREDCDGAAISEAMSLPMPRHTLK